MGLKVKEKTKIEFLIQTFNNLLSNNLKFEDVRQMLLPQINEIENDIGEMYQMKISHDSETNTADFEILDLSRDFLQLKTASNKVRTLRAKVHGVPVEIKIFKEDDYSFTNSDVHKALVVLTSKLAEFETEFLQLEDGRISAEKVEASNPPETETAKGSTTLEEFTKEPVSDGAAGNIAEASNNLAGDVQSQSQALVQEQLPDQFNEAPAQLTEQSQPSPVVDAFSDLSSSKEDFGTQFEQVSASEVVEGDTMTQDFLHESLPEDSLMDQL